MLFVSVESWGSGFMVKEICEGFCEGRKKGSKVWGDGDEVNGKR